MPDLNSLAQLVSNILESRYVPDSTKYLGDYFTDQVNSQTKTAVLLQKLLEQISNPELDTFYPLFPKFVIPQSILNNNKVVRAYVKKILVELLEKNDQRLLSTKDVEDFFIKHHENIKWAQNRWLVANPGLSLELLTISKNLHPDFLSWLKEKFQVGVGDPVVHLHVISNNGRNRLKEMGVAVPHDHWHESYYREMVNLAFAIAKSWSACKGLFCDSSWIFNPDNFTIAPDGKPFVAFTFLKDSRLYGQLFEVTNLISSADLETQKGFALRSERRKKFFDQGKFQVKVHGSFYPIEEIATSRVKFD